jgi:hypothetical protein
VAVAAWPTVEYRLYMKWWLLVAGVALGCPQPQSRPQGPTKDIAHFRMVTNGSTVPDVKRLVGEPDGDMGSGIFMYFWKLDDGTRVVVGTPDDQRVLYVDWVKADGTKERLVGAQPTCSGATERPSSSPLRTTLRIVEPRVSRIQNLVVEVTLSNRGPSPVRWLGTYVQSGSLALEVRDSSCKPVLPGPPPTPRADDGVTNWNTLAPAASVSFSLHGWVMTDVAPGHYEVRFAGIPGDQGNADIRSPWMPFEVTPPSN